MQLVWEMRMGVWGHGEAQRQEAACSVRSREETTVARVEWERGVGVEAQGQQGPGQEALRDRCRVLAFMVSETGGAREF